MPWCQSIHTKHITVNITTHYCHVHYAMYGQYNEHRKELINEWDGEREGGQGRRKGGSRKRMNG